MSHYRSPRVAVLVDSLAPYGSRKRLHRYSMIELLHAKSSAMVLTGNNCSSHFALTHTVGLSALLCYLPYPWNLLPRWSANPLLTYQSLYMTLAFFLFCCLCNSIILDLPLAHTRARTRDLLHTSTTDSYVVTHRSTKAAALAEQGELLLQGLRASDVTD